MGRLVELGYRDTNILNYTTWNIGTSGTQSGFAEISGGESFLVEDGDPWGNPRPVWEARPGATSDADGGWNGSYYGIDRTKLYRFVVWIRRTVLGNGSAYFGCNGGGAYVLNRVNGASNSNPYFWSGGWSSAIGSQWVLIVGHIWPAGSGTGANHPESGRYLADGSYYGGLGTGDFVWASTTTSVRHRAYLFYSTNTSTRQQFIYPRIDIVDGTEPSLNDLLVGYDAYTFDRQIELSGGSPDRALRLYSDHTEVNRITELGPMDGIVSYWPLDEDANDYSGNGNNGTANGALLASGKIAQAYSFNGTSDYISIPYSSDHDLQQLTISAWVNFTDDSQSFIFEKGNVNTQYALFSHSTDIVFRTKPVGEAYNTLSVTKAAAGITNGNWHHIVGTYDSYTKRLYVDGVEKISISWAKTLEYNANGSSIGRFGGTTTGYYFTGKIDDVRLYGRALSAQEVNCLYEVTAEKKIKLSNNMVFTNGIYEV